MKAILLIIDNREAYRKRLLAALVLREPNYECLALNDILQVEGLSQDKFNRVALILSADYFSSDLSKILVIILRALGGIKTTMPQSRMPFSMAK